MRGGSHIQLEVDMDAVTKEQMSNLVDTIRSTLRKERVGYTNLAAKLSPQPMVVFSLRNADQSEKALKAIRKIDPELILDVREDGSISATYTAAEFEKRRRAGILGLCHERGQCRRRRRCTVGCLFRCSC